MPSTLSPQRFASLMVILSAALVATIGAAYMTYRARSVTASPGITIIDQRPLATGADSPDATGLPVLFDAPPIDAIDQDARPLHASDLAGRPYVAAFMFTNCTTACPMIAGRLAALQTQITAPNLRFVSFSVDPVRDTPEVLKGYLTRFKAKPDRWMFATGTKAQMEAIETGFKLRLPRRDPDATIGDPNDPMSVTPHSDRLVLVDAQGRVRGVYSSKDDNSVATLRADAEALASLK